MRGRPITKSKAQREAELKMAINRSGFTREEVFRILNEWYGVHRNLTEHQKAVEEAAGMSLDWNMANAYTAGTAKEK
jgi:hypothetical protein